MEEGGDGVVRGARVKNAKIDMPRRGRPSLRRAGPRGPTGEAEPAGVRAALDCVTITFRYAHEEKNHLH